MISELIREVAGQQASLSAATSFCSVQDAMTRNSQYPCPDRAASLEAPKVTEYLDEYLLPDVIRKRVVAKRRVAHAVDVVTVFLHQVAQGAAVVAAFEETLHLVVVG